MSGPSGSDGGSPRLGSMFGRYRIESVVGRGGMGVVMRATDTELDRIVALKFLAPELRDDPVMRERFMREPRLAAAIEHPNIVPIHEAGVIDGVPFIAMRAIRGDDLATVLRREAPLSTPRTLAILAQLADALDTAHRRGLVHRDVKPGNVLLEAGEAGAPERAWLTDFGLTRRLGDASGLTVGGPLGTIDYLAPELIAGGEIGPWTDQYSLACLAVHCLTGSPPWDGPTDAAVLHAHVSGDRATLAARLPDPRVAKALTRALAPEPADRFPDCRSLVRAMEGGATEEDAAVVVAADPAARSVPAAAGVGAASDVPPPPTTVVVAPVGPGGSPRRRGAFAVLAVAAAALIGGAGLLAAVVGSPGGSPGPTSSAGLGPSVAAGAGADDGIIVFSGGKAGALDIWATQPDGGGRRRITDDPGSERWPTVSPDGRFIVYTAGVFPRRDLWIVNADGTGTPRKLTRDPGDDYAPAFSPEGDRLAWTSDRSGHYDIMLATMGGDEFMAGADVHLTGFPDRDDGRDDILPAWSPDGRWVYYSSNRGESSDIWRLDPDRPQDTEPVTDDDLLWPDNAPTVALDGDVWFVGRRGHDDRDLYEVTVGQQPIRRTTLGDEIIAPDVAPDGIRLVGAVGDVEDALDPIDTRLMILRPNKDGSGSLVKERVVPMPSEVPMKVATDPDWVATLADGPAEPVGAASPPPSATQVTAAP